MSLLVPPRGPRAAPSRPWAVTSADGFPAEAARVSAAAPFPDFVSLGQLLFLCEHYGLCFNFEISYRSRCRIDSAYDSISLETVEE